MKRLGMAMVVVGLFGCESGSEPIDSAVPAASAPAAPSASIALPPGAVSAASAAASPSASALLPPDPAAPRRAAVPTPPKDVSPRPTRDEWGAATEVNTGDPSRRPRGCAIRVLREWAQIGCTGSDNTAWPLSPWGKGGVDWFQDGEVLDVRLQPGSLLRGHVGSSHRAHFFIAWPTNDDKPYDLRLETPRPNDVLEPMPTPQPLPDVPTSDAPRPAEADWAKGVPVNTASTTPGRHCSLVVLQTWARLSCDAPPKGGIASWEKLSGFGAKDADHFFAARGIVGESFQLDFRLRKGMDGRAMLAWSSGNAGRVGLYAEWPAEAAQPTDLSLRENYP